MLFSLAGTDSEDAQRRHWRNLAWFPEPWTIAGKEVRVMTLGDYRALSLIGSPVIHGGSYSDEDVARFLWVLSPEFSRDSELFAVFALEVADGLAGCREELDEYLDFLFLDEPPSSSGGRSIATSYIGSLTHAFASSYGWSIAKILLIPVPQAYQLIKLIRRSSNPDAPDFHGGEARINVFLNYVNSLPIEERDEVSARVNRGETIEIPD